MEAFPTVDVSLEPTNHPIRLDIKTATAKRADMNTPHIASETQLTSRWTVWLFLSALVFHAYFVTVNWSWGFMLGHEFRQAQTALITEYIDKQDNFGTYYETPILGKPWAFPLEFPFYQWTVVAVKRVFDWEYFEAARAVSLACFYGALPAVFLLLGSFGVTTARRWVLLAVVLMAPVYIFYSRAFLIDPMAMMFSAWFLTAFIRAMQTRSWVWWSLAVLVGTVGILIKSLVFLVWLFPAALYGAWSLWQAWQREKTWQAVGRTVAFGVGAVILPYLAITWWVGYTDDIKEVHRSAYIFTSTALTEGNFGTFSIESRLAKDTWVVMGQRWAEALTFPVFILGYILFGAVCCHAYRKFIIGAFLIWMFGQLAFPYAYAFQDYYFYAGAIFVLLALGFVTVGILEKGRWPKLLRVGLACAPFGFLGYSYLSGYYQGQKIQSYGGSGMTALLNDMLPPDSVILGIGHDWSAIIPYYAKRKALMVRSGLENDEYLQGAVDDLEGEFISAVVISGAYRDDTALIEYVTGITGTAPYPLFRHRESLVFVSPLIYGAMSFRLGPGGSHYPDVELLPLPEDQPDYTLQPFVLEEAATVFAFPTVDPKPYQMRIRYGYGKSGWGDREVYSLHPDSDLWIEPRERRGSFVWRYGMIDHAWKKEGDKTDGVDFLVFIQNSKGELREIFRDEVTPATDETKRGIQESVIAYELSASEVLVFSSRARSSMAYDWAFIADLYEQ